MKHAGIISIGNELLSGQTVDTNAAYLGAAMIELSLPVVTRYTVGDDVRLIVRSLERAVREADVILMTGGLGPTDDDVTRAALAEFLGVELKLDSGLLGQIEVLFRTRGYDMPEQNRRQAYLPDGAAPIPNRYGTAPGIKVTHASVPIYVLPGVPSEMRQMFDASVVPELRSQADHAVAVRKLKCFGVGESSLVSTLGNRMARGRNPLINTTVSYGVITLHIIATADTARQADQLAQRDEAALRNLLGELVFGENDQSLADAVGQKLVHRNETLAVAESCTGGLLAKAITDVPGASRYFLQGWVTYTNQAKIGQLAVAKKTLQTHGAVSEPVAQAMALGARRASGADHAISITGIAGPAGGSAAKPVGLVFIGIDSDRGRMVKQFQFSRDRSYIRHRTVQTALHELWACL